MDHSFRHSLCAVTALLGLVGLAVGCAVPTGTPEADLGCSGGKCEALDGTDGVAAEVPLRQPLCVELRMEDPETGGAPRLVITPDEVFGKPPAPIAFVDARVNVDTVDEWGNVEELRVVTDCDLRAGPCERAFAPAHGLHVRMSATVAPSSLWASDAVTPNPELVGEARIDTGSLREGAQQVCVPFELWTLHVSRAYEGRWILVPSASGSSAEVFVTSAVVRMGGLTYRAIDDGQRRGTFVGLHRTSQDFEPVGVRVGASFATTDITAPGTYEIDNDIYLVPGNCRGRPCIVQP